MSDRQFDELYPLPVRAISATHWTPVRVALRAAGLLVKEPGSRVLDVGSGAGKFCLIAALVTDGRFFGIERCESMVACARDVATLVGAQNCTFSHGPFGAANPEDYDAVYFYNPFEEDSLSRPDQFDWPVPRAGERFEEDVYAAQQFLRAARPGTRVITYNGMGGALPSCYQVVEREEMGCTIELAVKSSNRKTPM